ncbi:MAG: glycosyltransferase family 4 protein [Chthoniobacteraceae bacterium]|jgi:glycosyltransferase involved in cell wall biosynthesis
MNPVFINNSVETFTPTQSGAIATHIHECCRAAVLRDTEPVVISIRCGAEPYSDVKTVLVDPPRIPQNRILVKLLRAERKITGWRHLRQRAHAIKVERAIRENGLERHPMILHNDPELAVFLRDRFPRAFLIHHFHNQIPAAPRFRDRYSQSANVTTGVSVFTSRWVEQAYGLRPSSVLTIHNGVDIERFKPAANRGDRLPVINFLGRTGIEKGPDLLLKAAVKLARKTRAFRVQMLGSNHWDKFERDDYQNQLDGLSRDLESAGVTVNRPGHIARAKLPAALREADINVVPSRWDEPFALTILEGMACGLASVVSRTGGAPEVVGDAGLLFERDSVDGLAAHLLDLIFDPRLRAEYALRARARAEQFTWQKTWGQFCSAAGM